MPLLLVLDGPPGVGKSTIARRYAADHALAFVLDIDVLRGLLGGWEEDPAAAGRAARRIALAAAETHLRAGHDVVVPQLVAHDELLDALSSCASWSGAAYVELFLTCRTDVALHRFAARGTADPEHAAAASLARAAGGEAYLRRLPGELAALATRRGSPTLAVDGTLEEAYAGLLALLASRRPGGRG